MMRILCSLIAVLGIVISFGFSMLQEPVEVELECQIDTCDDHWLTVNGNITWDCERDWWTGDCSGACYFCTGSELAQVCRVVTVTQEDCLRPNPTDMVVCGQMWQTACQPNISMTICKCEYAWIDWGQTPTSCVITRCSNPPF